MNRQQTALKSKRCLKPLGGKLVLILGCTFIILGLSGHCFAKDLPDAPSTVLAANGSVFESSVVSVPSSPITEPKPSNTAFLALAVISTGSAFADSYTTLFATENWLAGKRNVCNMEVQSAYLYGVHPTVGRTYLVASTKSAASIFSAYYLRKHHRKLWSMPLLLNSATSLEGVTQNMIECN